MLQIRGLICYSEVTPRYIWDRTHRCTNSITYDPLLIRFIFRDVCMRYVWYEWFVWLMYYNNKFVDYYITGRSLPDIYETGTIHDSSISYLWRMHVLCLAWTYTAPPPNPPQPPSSHMSESCPVFTHILKSVCYDWFICVTWLIHMCDMTHSYVWHDSFIYEPMLICCMSVTNAWVKSYLHVYEWVFPRMRTCSQRKFVAHIFSTKICCTHILNENLLHTYSALAALHVCDKCIAQRNFVIHVFRTRFISCLWQMHESCLTWMSMNESCLVCTHILNKTLTHVFGTIFISHIF